MMTPENGAWYIRNGNGEVTSIRTFPESLVRTLPRTLRERGEEQAAAEGLLGRAMRRIKEECRRLSSDDGG